MTLLIYLVQVTVCLAIFYGFYHFVLQKETSFQLNRIYLLSTMGISLILPVISISLGKQPEPLFVTTPQLYVASLENIVVSSTRDEGISWINLFMWVYLAGVVAMFARLIREILMIIRFKRTGKETEIHGQQCILTEKAKTPFSFFRTIYLPADYRFNDKELSEVILHERSHISGMHSIDVVFMEVIKIGLWISPIIYHYQKRLREVHEFLADASVIKHTDWEQYATFLIKQNNQKLQNILSNQLIYSQLKNRLVMMTQRPSPGLARLKYVGMLPFLALSLILFSFKVKPGTIGTELIKSGIDTLPTTYITALRIHDPASDGKMPTHVDSIWDYTRSLPVFPGCESVPFAEMGDCGMRKMTDYINDHMRYPESMRSAGIEGKVIIRFVVGADGYIQQVSVAESLHPDADAEVMNLFNGMNKNVGKWQPAAEKGIAKEAEMWLPVSFSLGTKNRQTEQQDEPYSYVEDMPRFPGCENFPESERLKCSWGELYKFIYEAIKYPKEDREKGNEGQVIAQFIIETDGTLSNIKVVRGVSPGLDAEAIRILKEMNNLPQKWIPGKHEGKKVRVQYTIPFKFVLQAEAK